MSAPKSISKCGRFERMKPKFELTDEVKRYLEKRIGPSMWDGIFFDGKGISSGHFSLMPDRAGQRIQEIMALYETAKDMLADCSRFSPVAILQMEDANARLIAAAPELYAALKSIVDHHFGSIEEMNAHIERHGSNAFECWHMAKAALAKAGGVQHYE